MAEQVKITMKHFSGESEDSRWFTFKPSPLAPTIRVEWEKDTMDIDIESDVASLLVRSGYATEVDTGEQAAPEGKAPSPPPPPPAAPAPDLVIEGGKIIPRAKGK